MPSMIGAGEAMTPKRAREVLNAPSNADPATLARAFRAAVKACHPDREGGDAERLRQVIEAHRLLQRLQDARRSAAVQPAFRPAAAPESRSQPTVETIDISITEALFGGERRIQLLSGRALDVRLPAGLRPGETLRLAAAAGGSDVHLKINVTGLPNLSVRGDDLWLKITAPLKQIDEGARLEVDTPRGRRAVWLSRKAGLKRLMRLPGEGLPARAGHARGDLFLRIEPEAAPAESPAQSMLRKFAQTWAA
jgi:curved DNA-binding protein